ncbi:arginine--tRNA ligase [Flavobacterium branchiophilum]|uniref:Arginine--tRNA ligase n=1 Tax=Flavobacterium branchiophilum TaxID=55197 RepID=A0A543G5Y9_9FLAO|nr:arginine--tRNA ligase [Flavobacterium branchiophilum]OXA75946.1 arginine--tRNA ligase [Flavobacterium branchiophilum] [Flavobacterium branchiophilum NBRC 15030 = ATCC 35035]TQM41491.1 arginyl-tRNA synthetase [Flavobacterium branchiophilum]GEM54193.1 arginine--tRNA ligase [Flavobacterium branchiophilum NBRC 15030 = ATCC 35035]
MNIQAILLPKIQLAIQQIFDQNVEKIEFQATRKDFEGDITIVIFPLLKIIKGNPIEIGNKIGQYVTENTPEIAQYNVVSGFLNLVIDNSFYLNAFNEIKNNPKFGFVTPDSSEKAIMVEYSSPNTNKPLHLGHVRNNLLGYSVAEILKASGKKVYKTQIINDRGIHICKSMLAWQKFGNGETPQSSGLKGDKLVGKYYVAFDQAYKSEIDELVQKGLSLEDAKKAAPIIIEAQQMLLDWEAGKPEVIELWKTMNQWVYDGFAETYQNLGVDFDSYYYESNTYLLGNEVIDNELAKGKDKSLFYEKEDGSVWVNLTEDGLDEKIVRRSDGTAVYMTQDIGTAIQRVKDCPDVGGMVYTVGNEQDYHFKVLFLILQKLGFDWSKNLYHLSYGMVDLPSGKMKSREGTVVDADDLMTEMTQTAQELSEELGKLEGYSEQEKQQLYKTIGLGALKYYILKVDPKKRILFDPAESVDFAGNTGPFIQYTFARIQSILRKTDFDYTDGVQIQQLESLHEKEKEIIKNIMLFPEIIQNAAQHHSPALIANYVYDLVKEYNSFYQTVSILGEPHLYKKTIRVQISEKVAQTISNAFALLGIDVPERM